MNPPELKETPELRLWPGRNWTPWVLKREEKAMAVIFLLLIGLWAGGRYIGLSETLTALLGLCLLLLTDVLTWDDIKK